MRLLPDPGALRTPLNDILARRSTFGCCVRSPSACADQRGELARRALLQPSSVHRAIKDLEQLGWLFYWLRPRLQVELRRRILWCRRSRRYSGRGARADAVIQDFGPRDVAATAADGGVGGGPLAIGGCVRRSDRGNGSRQDLALPGQAKRCGLRSRSSSETRRHGRSSRCDTGGSGGGEVHVRRRLRGASARRSRFAFVGERLAVQPSGDSLARGPRCARAGDSPSGGRRLVRDFAHRRRQGLHRRRSKRHQLVSGRSSRSGSHSADDVAGPAAPISR